MRAAVLGYLDQHPGVHIHLSEIQEATGNKFPDNGIRNTLSALRVVSGMDIKAISAGNVWVYKPTNAMNADPKKPNGKRMFEEIGPTKEGHIIIQADDGALYRAEAL